MKGCRLNRDEYEDLHRCVMKRDGWRCQVCGSRTELQVHHMHSRAQLGADVEDNLFTVCAACHRAIHLDGAEKSFPPTY
jgi:5-methylcytosine-specific restriction endonuclease McrA